MKMRMFYIPMTVEEAARKQIARLQMTKQQLH